MTAAISLALGTLVACFIAASVCYGRVVWRMRMDFRNRMDARVRGRPSKPVDRIFDESWKDQPVDLKRFDRIWRSAASCFRIPPDLMRPDDRVEDLIVRSDMFWPGPGDDIAEFFVDLLPHDEALALAEKDYETVADLVQAVVESYAHTMNNEEAIKR